MPQHAKGIRLWQRPDTGIWFIKHTGRGRRSTGTRDRAEAEKILAAYIVESGRAGSRNTPDQFTVAEALEIYAAQQVPNQHAPDRSLYAIEALLPILGALKVADITAGTCRRYERERNRKAGTIRRELNALQAAMNYCHAEGYLTHAPKVKLPPAPPPRDRWLTRSEAARLLWACRKPENRHVARFILVALYTGTRSAAILRMRFMPNTEGGWVDTERGIMHRRGVGMAETKKRQPPAPIPRQLLAHLRRWERNGARYVVEVRGCRVASIKTAWNKAVKESGIAHCVKHDLRHTAITWAMQNGAEKWAAAGFFGVGMDLLERVYGHHHPDHLASAVAAMERRALPAGGSGRKPHRFSTVSTA